MTSSTINCSEPFPGTGRLFDRARNRFWLAPMAGITQGAYRQLMDEMSAGVLISELVSTKGLKYGSGKTRQMIEIHKNPGTLVGIQLFGEDTDDYLAVADQVAEAGADFIDINLGCPVKKIIKKGCGAALMRDPVYLEQFLSTIRKGIGLPLTVKMRTGWNDRELTIHECVQAASNAGCEWVAIHGRTREQSYSGRADWNLIAEVKRRTSIPIIGNGDIRSASRAHRLLEETGVDAVMIGRGALRNPWIFRQCTAEFENPHFPMANNLIRRYHDLLSDVYDKRLTAMFLKKFTVWLAFGYPGVSAFRGRIFELTTTKEVLDLSNEFFSKIAHLPLPDFNETEAFMMGGHG